MNIYDEDSTYKAQVSNILAEPYPLEGFKQEEGFSVVFEAAAGKAYDNLGLGSYKAASQFGQYGKEYTKLAQEGKLRAMGIDPHDYSMAPGLAYMKHKDTIEEYAAKHPEEGITLPSALEKARLDDMKETEEHYRDVYSRASSLGKVGGFLGSVFGAMTDPVNLALTAIPTGLVAGSAATLLSQVPRIIGMSAIGATAGSLTSKYRDLQYRSDVQGEDISKLSSADIAKEIGIESAIGTVVGAGLVAGGAAIGKALKAPSIADNLAPAIQKDVTVTGEKTPQIKNSADEKTPQIKNLADEKIPQKPAGVSQAEHAMEHGDTQAVSEIPWEAIEQNMMSVERFSAFVKMKQDLGEPLTAAEKSILDIAEDVTVTGEKIPQVATEDNPYSMQAKNSLKLLEGQQKMSEFNPEIQELKLTDEQTNALHILREADEIMSQKPAGVSQADHAMKYGDTRAMLEIPWEAIEQIKMKHDFGEPLTAAEKSILDTAEDANIRFEEGYRPVEKAIPEEELVSLHPDEMDVTIDGFLMSNILDKEDLSPVKAFLEEFSSEKNNLAKLTQCLLTPKPRIKA